MRFQLLADTQATDGGRKHVMTGHQDGRITINIAEADDAIREMTRSEMGEPYRTLIGHFRHEVGHFYWDRLVNTSPWIDKFRQLFGDERSDYGEALQRHYEHGGVPGWQRTHVSSYAASHPWEDFAETWSHFFHIVDGLETAAAYGLSMANAEPGQARVDGELLPYQERDVRWLLNAWVPLTVAMNEINRSIGNSDFYPFVLSDVIMRKLDFIGSLIHNGPPE